MAEPASCRFYLLTCPLFVLDEFPQVLCLIFELVIGELNEELTGVEEPPEDDLYFGWCPFGEEFPDGEKVFSFNRFIVCRGSAEEVKDEWDEGSWAV